MSLRFYLIDDDPATRRMLEKIILDTDLGEIVGQASDGRDVSASDLRGVDVVLIDLLMPGRDGIETIRELQQEGYHGRFIMISQIENKEMVGDAYSLGIDTFIKKPVNRMEVTSVLKRVADHLQLETSLLTIRRSLQLLDDTSPDRSRESTVSGFDRNASQILSQLGTGGESGALDILAILRWVNQEEKKGSPLREWPPLKDIYQAVLSIEHPKLQGESFKKEVRAMEQRIRRAILQALTHLASLGLTDYSNPTFEHFAPRLFDFQEVRIRMQELESNGKTTHSRINIRKFLYSLYQELPLY